MSAQSLPFISSQYVTNPCYAKTMDYCAALEARHSKVLRVISYIPAIGVFSTVIQGFALVRHTSRCDTTPRAIELVRISTKNQIASVVRKLLTVALIIAGFAFGVISGSSCALYAGILIGLSGLQLSAVSKNNQVLERLESEGLAIGRTQIHL